MAESLSPSQKVLQKGRSPGLSDSSFFACADHSLGSKDKNNLRLFDRGWYMHIRLTEQWGFSNPEYDSDDAGSDEDDSIDNADGHAADDDGSDVASADDAASLEDGIESDY